LIDFGLTIPVERQGKKPRWNVEESDALFKHRVGAGEQEVEIDEDSLFLEDLPGGTPAYMAPEVLEDPSLVDGRADLYGLGATLYHAATGHPPYTGETMEQVLYQQKNQLPAPITQFNADFPDELSELILQLLAQQPSGRPRSSKLCLNKLQRLEDPSSVPTYKPTPGPAPSASSSASGVVVAAVAPPPEVEQKAGFWLGLAIGVVAGMVLTFVVYFMGLLPPVD
jgi:serine/threonine-protein kinase